MRYDCFLSYSHRADRELARALQRALQGWGIATPGRRRLRVFRDETNLAAHPHLWQAIQRAIDGAGYFILLASPESARSSWVAKEVAHFIARQGPAGNPVAVPHKPDRIGIAWTSGALPWSWEDSGTKQGAFAAAESALALEVAALFPEEPLVVDLRSFREKGDRAELNSRAATFVAAILGRDKDEVFGEHLRAQRRFIAALCGGIALLLGASIFAFWQWQRASAEAHRADLRAREAIARRIAAESDRIAEASPATALLLLAHSFLDADSPAVRANWWRLLNERDLPSVFLPERAERIRFTEDGAFCASSTVSDGDLSTDPDGLETCYISGPEGWERAAAAALFRGEEAEVTWRWSGNCDNWNDPDTVCQCARSEARIIGSHGDTDDFCIASMVAAPAWCGGAAIEIPGVEVVLEQSGAWLHVASEDGSAQLYCPRSETGEVAQPTLVAGDLPFFPGDPALPMLRRRGTPPVQLARSLDGQWLGVSRLDGTVEIWSASEQVRTANRRGRMPLTEPGEALAIAAAATQDLVAIAMSPRDGTREGDVVVSRVGHEAERLTVSAIHRAWSSGRRGALTLSHDGQVLAGGVDVEVGVWSTASGAAIGEAAYIQRNRLRNVNLSPDGSRLSLALAPLDGALPPGAAVFRVGDSNPERPPLGTGVRDVAFLDRSTLLTASASGVERWNLEQPDREAHLVDSPARALAVDLEARRFAAVLESEELVVWDQSAGESPLARSSRRAGETAAIAFVLGQELLLRASDLGLEAWHWGEDSWLTIESTPFSDVSSAASNGAVGLTEAQAVAYTFDPDRWLELTCRLVRRNLTQQEWTERIGSGFPYACTCSDWCLPRSGER